eukprot:c8946_g1_i1.p1 GENE.c8946_g1_i1~~c8946_g1_i1.p1  ORF type:complete len:428 (-),score=68.27 c8946_g1_i1:111-1394(-)
MFGLLGVTLVVVMGIYVARMLRDMRSLMSLKYILGLTSTPPHRERAIVALSVVTHSTPTSLQARRMLENVPSSNDMETTECLPLVVIRDDSSQVTSFDSQHLLSSGEQSMSPKVMPAPESPSLLSSNSHYTPLREEDELNSGSCSSRAQDANSQPVICRDPWRPLEYESNYRLNNLVFESSPSSSPVDELDQHQISLDYTDDDNINHPPSCFSVSLASAKENEFFSLATDDINTHDDDDDVTVNEISLPDYQSSLWAKPLENIIDESSHLYPEFAHLPPLRPLTLSKTDLRRLNQLARSEADQTSEGSVSDRSSVSSPAMSPQIVASSRLLLHHHAECLVSAKTVLLPENIDQMLSRLGMSMFVSAFAQEEIDIEALQLMSEVDLLELGLPMPMAQVLWRTVQNMRMSIIQRSETSLCSCPQRLQTI